jgi:PAS domain S-box-containing protein
VSKKRIKRNTTLVGSQEKSNQIAGTISEEWNLFQTLMDNLPDTIYFKDRESRFIKVNKGFLQKFNIATESEILNKTDHDIFQSDHANDALNDEMEIIQTGKSIINKIENETWLAGKVTWASTTKVPLKDSEGKIIGTFGLSRDITDMMFTEQELKKLYFAIEQSPAAVILTDANGKIEYVNAMFTKMSGYNPGDIKGKVLKILKDDSHRIGDQNIWDTLLHGFEWKGEFYNKRKDGIYYWESALLSPIYNEEGTIKNILAIQEDITEKKKVFEELILAKVRAEEANNAKDIFLRNMSHELRTPLIVILGYSQLIMEESLEPNTCDMATDIKKGGIRLLNAINSILDLSMIKSDNSDLELNNVNIADEIKNIFDAFQEAAQKKKIEYSLQKLNDRLFTKMDQRVFRTIIGNLIDNAIKFTNQGSITVISGIDSDNTIYITVKDTGIGMAAEHHEMIFEEFRQVSEGINREYQGTGLGLTIAKKYLDILGGTISVESELGVGSSFTVRFPLVN